MNTKNIVSVLALGIGSLASAGAYAHAKIEVAEPKANSELAAAPKVISLQFNERLEPAFSKIELFDGKDATIKLPKAAVDQTDPKKMTAQLPSLRAGQYLVRWTAMTHDGHKVKGDYRFKVK